MIPSIANQKTDGNLGVVSDTDRILAIIAPASSGPTTANALSDKNDITDTYTSGPLVEGGVYALAQEIPVVLIKAVATTNGTYGTIVHTGVAGSASIAAGATHPDNDYDVIVKTLIGGALGTAGIVFIYSLDNGVNWSQNQALGTSLTMTLERGVSFTLSSSASTLLAGDTFSCPTVAPQLTSGDIATALATLKDYSGEWLRCLVIAHADATIIAELETEAGTYHGDGKYPEFITCTRPRGLAEDRPTYQTAMAAISNAVQTTETSPCVDQCEVVSSVDGRRLRMPSSIPYAARLMINDDSVDASAKALGALPSVFLETAAGARNYHDERRYPGFDDLGFTTLRSFGGRPVSPGAYVNNPRLLSGSGSDYRYFQLTAIVNRAIEDTFTLLQPKLSMSAMCDRTTGRIRDDVAGSIEDAVNGELRTRFIDTKPPRASAVSFKLSRTDDVIGTDSIHFDTKLVPLAYLKKFIGKTGLVRSLPA